jgi:hypothetical protein
MKRTFLYKVWLHDRRLFYVMAVFSVLTILFNVLGDEVTPFFVWGMYSEKEKPVQQYEILRTTVNDSLVVDAAGGYADATRFYLTGPLASYKKIKDNGGIDPVKSFLQQKLNKRYEWVRFAENKVFYNEVSPQAFFTWYSNYLQQVTNVNVHTVQVDVVQVHYDREKIVVDSLYLFHKWKKP